MKYLNIAIGGTAIAALLAFAPPAHADVIINGVSYIDPTSFHVTSSVATGSDPVLLNNSSAFSIQDNGGQNIDKPLTIYIAVPTGAAAPTITSASYLFDSQPATPVAVTFTGTVAGTFSTAGSSDLYTFVGCVACDNSLNAANITTAYQANGIVTPNSLTVFTFSANQAFQGKDEINFIGSFAKGDIIFPFAENGAGTDHITIFDTSWTNTGLVNTTTVTPPPPPPPPPDPVPEPGALAMLGTMLAGLGGMAYLRRRRS